MTAPTPREAADIVGRRLGWLDEGGVGELASALIVLRDHARATTPGDDRGRELAEAWDGEARAAYALAGRMTATSEAQHAHCARGDVYETCAAQLRRALAAPAQTEADRDV